MRAPFQVLVFPYQILNEQPRYLIGQRSDNGAWQAISGGGEDNESILEAAKRELKEETCLIGCDWQQLDSMCMLPKVYYAGHENWTNHQFVVPEYSFSVRVSAEPQLSNEHTTFRWCSFQEGLSTRGVSNPIELKWLRLLYLSLVVLRCQLLEQA
ncbi:NUDIX pyrophosphatase [Aeromonas popoffii]|uniref:NUDIX pyrophosphatase n=1 Tax=Aeromonas popoffii TaxID=70856 RepID=A0ABS5GU21_9GAMM|nr:NUDIX pyrophosphatase [Aeromonas popoffii]MBR7630620.1 NUDIX pyrophosphatase [Aeromonas popoffii]